MLVVAHQVGSLSCQSLTQGLQTGIAKDELADLSKKKVNQGDPSDTGTPYFESLHQARREF